MKKTLARSLARREINGFDKCEVCGIKGIALDRHHTDYDRPLEVKIMCKKCHKKWHMENIAINGDENSSIMLTFIGNKEELHNWLKKLKQETGQNIGAFIIKSIEEKKDRMEKANKIKS